MHSGPITLTEEFDNPTGEWTNYDNYTAEERALISSKSPTLALVMDTTTKRLIKNTDPQAIPGNWPIMWRAHEPSGEDDPRPIDVGINVIFYTGARVETNTFTLYFREVTKDLMTQLDLNGKTQSELDGHPQPDLGEAAYSPRTQIDLSRFDNEQLQGQSMFTLERNVDQESRAWVQFTCQWSSSGGTVTITDTESNGVTIPLSAPLLTNSSYAFIASIEENSVHAEIYRINFSGVLGTKVFDSSVITNDVAYKRRAGRFGWHADLRDSDAYIDSIREKRVTYAEYRSLPLQSNTPIVGAELFATYTPDIEHFNFFTPNAHSIGLTSVTRDTERSTTGESWRVKSPGGNFYQGIDTNLFLLTDFDHSEIEFDLYYPKGVYGLEAALVNEFGTELLMMFPYTTGDQWERVRIPLRTAPNALTGNYRFRLMQMGDEAIEWWIDNVTIFSRTVVWDARAEIQDPWNTTVTRWTPFGRAINRESGGVLFPVREKSLQIRGRALRPNVEISRVQFKPKHAELGRFVDPFIVPADPYEPTISISTTGLSRERSFQAVPANEADSDKNIVLFEWSFGDGTSGIGTPIYHRYSVTGTYPVTLTATDVWGRRKTTSTTVAV